MLVLVNSTNVYRITYSAEGDMRHNKGHIRQLSRCGKR